MAVLNYLGAKGRLADWILSQPEVLTIFNQADPLTGVDFIDLFSGTGELTRAALTKLGSTDSIFAVEALTAPFAVNAATLVASREDSNRQHLRQVVNDFNAYLGKADEDLVQSGTSDIPFVREYAVKRSYFSLANAYRIHWVRTQLESPLLRAQDKVALVGLLVQAADKVANVTSVYGACLKELKKTARASLSLVLPPLVESRMALGSTAALRMDVFEGLAEIMHAQACSPVSPGHLVWRQRAVYADPPYNSRDYHTYYHLLETIALWDLKDFTPEGKTGQRPKAWRVPSEFGLKRKAPEAFAKLFAAVGPLVQDDGVFLLSYSNEALLSEEQMLQLLAERFQSVRVAKHSLKRFNSQKTQLVDKQVEELLFICSKPL